MLRSDKRNGVSLERRTGGFQIVLACALAASCGLAWSAPRSTETISAAVLDASEPNGLAIHPSSIRYRTGDDASWKDPGFNDADWDLVGQFEYPLDGPAAGPPFKPIWFRFEVHFAPALIGRPLLLKTYFHEKGLEVYLNGNRAADVQCIDPTAGVTPRCIVPVQTGYLIALRWNPADYRLSQAIRHKDPARFTLFVQDYGHALDQLESRDQVDRALVCHRVALIAAFVMFFLFHLALYTHYPLRRENIYYGMTALFCALALGSLHVSEVYRYNEVIWGLSYMQCFFAFMPLSVLSGFGLFQLLLIGRIRWTLPAYAAAGFVCYVAAQRIGSAPVHWFPLLMAPEMAVILWFRYRTRGLALGWSVVAGPVLASVMLGAAASLSRLQSDSGFVRYAPWYFSLVLLQAVAVAFVREYAADKKRIVAFAASLEGEVAARTRELESEISVRREAEEALNRYQSTLEDIVRRRTEELETKSSRLAEEIVERERAEEAFQAISRRLSDLRDEERRRMARELHDSVAQELMAIIMNLGRIEDVLPPKQREARELLASTLALGEHCSQEVRTLSYLLYPPLLDQLGLAPALRSYVDGFAKRSGIPVSVTVPPDFARMPADIELAIFRVMQECLGNVHRHAKSAIAHIRLEQDSDKVVLEVRDEGQGIPAETLAAIQQHHSSGGVGIVGMQERMRLLHGAFSVESTSRGTTVRVTIPFGGCEHQHAADTSRRRP